MFEYVRATPSRNRNFSSPPLPATWKFPFRLAIISAAVVMLAVVLAFDEGRQFDPASERARLENDLKAIASNRDAVLARKAKIEELVAKAASGNIPEERLPPVWQTPLTFKNMDDWHAAARRRLKRCSEELQALDAQENRTREDLNELPADSAKRTSWFRRVLNSVLGNFEPKEVE